ncbi:alpha/beta hydrolase [Pilimelia anulata]|uniref:Alpha/beta hydrolase n=1 Tax=Pilimelia anulata TaxID=53371 RepID=A0A8J3FAK2_9ACTN|nr:alpha/beta family hydrolase [Pilimelia anulata]GGK01282.1 alpha/beta hydrolase [Pilimelia anulata]
MEHEPYDVATPSGPARLDLTPPGAGAGHCVLALGHGAGGAVDAPDLRAVTAAVAAAGGWVARITQPYRVAGRRAPAPAPRLDEAWAAVLAALPGLLPAAARGLPLVAGGRSSGARVACRTAGAVGAAGVLALAFPTHPPGRPERSRVDELAAVPVPALVVNGDRDPFGVPPVLPGVELVVRPGDRHALSTSGLGESVVSWLYRWSWLPPERRTA